MAVAAADRVRTDREEHLTLAWVTVDVRLELDDSVAAKARHHSLWRHVRLALVRLGRNFGSADFGSADFGLAQHGLGTRSTERRRCATRLETIGNTLSQTNQNAIRGVKILVAHLRKAGQ
ncbi:hypothetical protein GCM10023317_52590 [Actinopolymorpha pittospori]